MNAVRLVLFTRFPEPGKAKTRLIPALGPEGAASLHRRLTERNVLAARAAGLPVEVRYTGADASAFAEWLGKDLRLKEQGEGDLGERLRRAAPPYPVLFIGSDLPDLTAADLKQAAELLTRHEVVIGPADDGGYWALGLSHPADHLFHDMPWGTDRVLAETLRRHEAVGVAPALLRTLADCDRPEDLARWPDLFA